GAVLEGSAHAWTPDAFLAPVDVADAYLTACTAILH
ncbi:MAG: hypothetical protein ACI8T1_003702, partial [Verrucomicrobiales bacterium]